MAAECRSGTKMAPMLRAYFFWVLLLGGYHLESTHMCPIRIEEVGLLRGTQWGWYLLRLRTVRIVFFGSLLGRNSNGSMGDGPTLTKLKSLFRRALAHSFCADDTQKIRLDQEQGLVEGGVAAG
jgi:hypothetical protein